MKGIVKKYGSTLVVAFMDKKSEYYKTQQYLSISLFALKHFDLKENDIVDFNYGKPFSYIKIISKQKYNLN
jgi:hypothetical protein